MKPRTFKEEEDTHKKIARRKPESEHTRRKMDWSGG